MVPWNIARIKMNPGHPFIVPLQKPPKDLSEIPPLRRAKSPDNAEIHRL